MTDKDSFLTASTRAQHPSGSTDHCWHFQTRTDTGLEGWDIDQCCWCGQVQEREWVRKGSPDHGQFYRSDEVEYRT